MFMRMSFPGLNGTCYPSFCKTEPIEEIIKFLDINRFSLFDYKALHSILLIFALFLMTITFHTASNLIDAPLEFSNFSWEFNDMRKKTDEYGLNALSFVVQRAEETESLRLLQLLIERFGVDVQQLDNHQQNSLFYAAREGHLKCCAYLLECGININHIDKCGQTALFYAAREGCTEIVKFLVKKGCSLHQADTVHGETPLFYAAVHGQKETVEIMLIELGANAAHLNFAGKTAASMARRINSRSTSLLLEQETKKALYALENAAIASSMHEVSPSLPSNHSNKNSDDVETNLMETASTPSIKQLHPVSAEKIEFNSPEYSAVKATGCSKENEDVCSNVLGPKLLECTANLTDTDKDSKTKDTRNGKRCLQSLQQNGTLCSAITQENIPQNSYSGKIIFCKGSYAETKAMHMLFKYILALTSSIFIKHQNVFYRQKYRLQCCEKDGKWKFPTARKMQEFENRFPDIAIWTKKREFSAFPVSSDISVVINPSE
ncbi:hypothetical protein IE077_002853 [Cardiosporidium cionae]|uniref:Uncharacterized protein n=1 Tax=Cardiosporidium cionae TaxID=476202 RepID=A0ABQ7J9R2_9APIC|nr:hypothetical protein IE077_002853 [Cardiosporidium cionae]|eukprot:KAF8820742.1 hypothetical protein IE077_002853 [Cardiosporidium cionae]